MVNYSEQDLLDGIRQGYRDVISYIMMKNADSIKKMIFDFKIGRFIQPEDVIQEGMITLILNLKQDKFQARSTVNTYYYSICRFICLKIYNKNKVYNWELGDAAIQNTPDNDALTGIEKNFDAEQDNTTEKLKFIIELIKKMKKECVEIIDSRFGLLDENLFKTSDIKIRPFEEIAELLKIENANARQRFSRCIKALISEFQKHFIQN